MNEKYALLLAHLRSNSRQKLTEISKETKIPISTLFDQLKELQQEVITKSTVLLDFSQLGYHAHAQVFLKVNQEQREALKKRLLLQQNVNSLYKVNNGWDFLLETVHSNIRELDHFLEQLSQRFEIKEQQIHYLVQEIKKESFSF